MIFLLLFCRCFIFKPSEPRSFVRLGKRLLGLQAMTSRFLGTSETPIIARPIKIDVCLVSLCDF